MNRLTRDDIRDRFAAYFSAVSYSVWDDLQPPHVAVATEGRSAWMAVEIEARLTATGAGNTRQVASESSWIAVYEKQNDEWRMVGIPSSVVERS